MRAIVGRARSARAGRAWVSDSITYFFVVQPGSLSFRARFLAASLRECAPPGSRIEAFLPETHQDIDTNTRRTLDFFGVHTRTFRPVLWPGHDYAIGNKVDASAQGFQTAHAVFLDTDIVVTRPFDPAPLCQGDLAAVPIMGAQVFSGAQGQRFSAHAKRALGVERVALNAPLRRARDMCPQQLSTRLPLFNSGVVAFRTGSGFAARWHARTAQVLGAPDLPERMKRPFADQAALAMVAYELRAGLVVLERKWNASFRSGIDEALFWHYFRVFSILQKQAGRRLFLATHRRYLNRGLNLLGEVSEKDLSDFFDSAKEFRAVSGIVQARAAPDDAAP